MFIVIIRKRMLMSFTVCHDKIKVIYISRMKNSSSDGMMMPAHREGAMGVCLSAVESHPGAVDQDARMHQEGGKVRM